MFGPNDNIGLYVDNYGQAMWIIMDKHQSF